MTTVGLLPSQQLVTLSLDENGKWQDVPNGQIVVSLVKIAKPPPAHGFDFVPKVVWFDDHVERQWEQVKVATPAPTVVTLRSFRRACGRVLWSSLEAVVAADMDEDRKWDNQQFLEYSATVASDHPLVAQLAALLGKTQEEIDAIFAAAASLE